MQIQIDRHYTEWETKTIEVNRTVEIYIGDVQYTLKETADGKLEINKHCHRDNAIVIFPRVTNVIDIS